MNQRLLFPLLPVRLPSSTLRGWERHIWEAAAGGAACWPGLLGSVLSNHCVLTLPKTRCPEVDKGQYVMPAIDPTSSAAQKFLSSVSLGLQVNTFRFWPWSVLQGLWSHGCLWTNMPTWPCSAVFSESYSTGCPCPLHSVMHLPGLILSFFPSSCYLQVKDIWGCDSWTRHLSTKVTLSSQIL